MTALRRVRPEEWLVGVLSLALLAVLFGPAWYRVAAYGIAGPLHYRDLTGWQSLSIVGPLALVVAVGGVALVVVQAARAAPALPVSASGVEAVLAFVLTLGLVFRVLIDQPALTYGSGFHNSVFRSVVDVRSGAYAGLGLAIAVLAGSYWSLRRDGTPALAPGSPPIETLRVGPGGAAS